MKKMVLFFSFLFALAGAYAKKKKVNTTIFQMIENKGQFHPNAFYRVNVPSGNLYLENNTFTYHFYDGSLLDELHHGHHLSDSSEQFMRFHAYKVKFENANPKPQISATKKTGNYYNFFLGNDKSKWASKVPAFEEVNYTELYPGIDLKLYKDPYSGLKYDLIVAPHSDESQIQLSYTGLDSIYLKNGKLYVITSLNENWEEKPEAWQIIEGKKHKVNCKYQLEGNTLSYSFPNGYDKNHELIIDPVLIFSSYSGSTSNNFGYTATYDKFGFLYSGSTAFGPNYPTTVGAYQTVWGGAQGIAGTDIAITKWDTTGTSLIYSTYLGGSGDELPHSLVVTEYHELYIMGTTGSFNYPVTAGAFDTSFNVANPPIPVWGMAGLGVSFPNGVDIVVSKLDSTGSSLEASTYLGGTEADGINNGVNKYNYADEVRGEIDLDHKGNVYIASCTRSNDNPIGSSGFQTTKPLPATNQIDGIIYKLNHNLSSIVWTNYLGGMAGDAVYSIAITDNNDIYVTGGTQSSNFPVTANAIDTSYSGANDAFVAYISEDGNTLISSTFYGSANYDQSYFVELDFAGFPHIFGQTSAPQGELIQNANYHDSLGGQFITKFNPGLDSVIWSTRFGSGDGNPDISPTAFLVDVCSAIYLSGWGSNVASTGNPVLSTAGLDTAGGPIQGITDGNDLYIMVLSADANTLDYATFFGGSSNEHVDGGTSRFDRKGKIYQAVCAGCQGLHDFPTYPNPGAWSNTNGSSFCNLAVFKMDFLLPIVVADFDAPSTGCAPFSVTFDNLSLQQSQTTFLWDFGDGTTSTQFEPTHIYNIPGVYTIKLYVSDSLTCNLGDSIVTEITILNNTNSTLPPVTNCNGEGTAIGIPFNPDPKLNYLWSPTAFLSDTAISDPIANPPVNTTYTLIIDNGICFDTITQTVQVDTISTEILGDAQVCLHDAPFLLTSNSSAPVAHYHWSNFSDFSDTIPGIGTGETTEVTPLDSLNVYYLQVTTASGCTAIDSFFMEVRDLQDPIIADFTYPLEGCVPALIPFVNTTDSLTTTSYLWDFGDGNFSTQSNPSNYYTTKGTYTITLIALDSSICPQSDTISKDIVIKADSNYSVTSIACYGQETEIGIPWDSNTTYSWTPTIGLSDSTINNPIITTTVDLTYTLIAQHVCTDTITNHVQVSDIQADVDSIIIICSDNPNVNLTGNSFGTGIQFIWSTLSNFGDTINTNLNDSTARYNQVDTYQYYYFKAINIDGCEMVDSIYSVISDQTISIASDTFICQLDSVELWAVNEFPYNSMSFYWAPASEIIGPIDTTRIQVAPSQSTWYYLTAVNDSGCAYTDSVQVEVSILNDSVIQATSAADSVILGFSTQVSVTPGTGFNYRWTPAGSVSDPNESVTTVTPPETTTYSVIVSDPNNSNCSYSDEVTIRTYEINCGEPDIFIPNAFSPNLDGENDTYLVTGAVVETMDLKIYTRWGELVFETTDPTQGWDGTFNGKQVDPVVFMYHLTVGCIDKREFIKKGNITVVR